MLNLRTATIVGGSGLTGKNAKTEAVVTTTMSKAPSFVFIQLVGTQLTEEKNRLTAPHEGFHGRVLLQLCQYRV